MTVRPPDLVYAVDERPPLPRLALLGLQYAVLVSVYLVLLVIITRAAGVDPYVSRNVISVGLLAGAAGTMLQSYNGRFFGSGYLAPPVFSAIYLAPSLLAAERGGLPAVAGMTIFAGVVELILSRFLVRLRVVFQPLISGFTVFVVGVQLGLVAITHALDVPQEGQSGFGWHVFAGFLTLAVCVGLSVWGRGVLRLMSALIGLAAGVVVAGFAGIFQTSEIAAVAAAPWVALPDPSFISFGFDFTLAPVFLAAALAATIRTVGVVTTCQRINDAAWKRPDVANLSRGVVGDGLGAVAAGLLGVMGVTAGPSLAGLSRATGAASRVIGYATAAILVLFAFIPKISAAILSLPIEVDGGILIFTASFMITSGIQLMALRGLDVRGGFAISVAFLFGLVAQLHPAYFAKLPDALRGIASDMLTLCLVWANLLMAIFRIGIRRSDTVAWRAEDGSLVDFAALLDKEGKAWKLDDELAKRARESVANLVTHLTESNCLEEPKTISASFDDLELRVDIAYRGRPLHLASHPISLENLHDETATTAGLDAFLAGVHADRASVATHGDDVTVRLWFAA